MKKLIALLMIGSVAFVSCKSEKKEATEETTTATEEVVAKATDNLTDGAYNVVTDASTLQWKGFKPTGTHNGTVALQSGAFKVENGMVTNGKFMFDMTTITVLDIPADDEYNEKLRSHLASGDFFNVENFATATFVTSNVTKTAEGYSFAGDLTIKDITKPVSFDVVVTEGENGITLKSEGIKIDRTEFDIRYKSNKFFDNLKENFINDEFEIGFEVVGAAN